MPIWFLALIAPLCCAVPAETSASLVQVAERALTQGEDGKLNVEFARVLGLKADQPLLLKRLQLEKDGATHVLNVLRNDANTIILYERRSPNAT